MIEIDLREYAETEHTVTASHLDLLLSEGSALNLTVQPAPGTGGTYRLTAGPTVGAVEIGDLSVLIQPKLAIPQLLSLVCYATGLLGPREESLFDFEEHAALPDALAMGMTTPFGPT